MPSQTTTSCSQIALDAMLAEYEAVYRLAEFRLGALDRRIPLIGGALTGFLSAVPMLPGVSQVLGLLAIPVSLIWLVRTTVTHAQSFEDAIRAIEVIEMRINDELGDQILSFQSTHPSRGRSVGGRTGSETVSALLVFSCLLLSMSLWIGTGIETGLGWFNSAYSVFIACISVVLIRPVWSWKKYRYQAQTGSN